jgi:hypothetical protein
MTKREKKFGIQRKSIQEQLHERKNAHGLNEEETCTTASSYLLLTI